MKKLYVLILAAGISSVAFSQQRTVGSTTAISKDISAVQKFMTPTDTLYGWLLTGGTPTVYTSTNGGYVGGVNGYGDFAKMQQFNVIAPYDVEGCIFWFGGKGAGGSTGNPNSVLTLKIYNMDATGSTSVSTTAPAPGTVATSTTYLWDDIDTSSTGANGFVIVTFPTVYNATASYAAGVDFTTLATTDTTGLVSSTSGEAGATELSWEMWNDNSLHTIYSAWGTAPNNVDIDFGIFPIIDASVGIEEHNFINGISLYQNQPNPFKTESVITYGLNKPADDVKIMIFDLEGKLIQTIEQGSQTAGEYNIRLTGDDFTSGVYYFAIQADHNRIAKKMMVVK